MEHPPSPLPQARHAFHFSRDARRRVALLLLLLLLPPPSLIIFHDYWLTCLTATCVLDVFFSFSHKQNTYTHIFIYMRTQKRTNRERHFNEHSSTLSVFFPQNALLLFFSLRGCTPDRMCRALQRLSFSLFLSSPLLFPISQKPFIEGKERGKEEGGKGAPQHRRQRRSCGIAMD